MIVMRKTWNRLFVQATLVAAAVAFAAAFLPADQAVADLERPLCKVCRRYIDTSPSQAQAYLDYNGRTKVVEACSLFCLFEILESRKGKLQWIYVQNHDTRNDPEPLPIKAQRAWFLYDAEVGDETLSHEPYIYAFTTEATAQEFAEELGGEVLNWDAVQERVKALTDEWEPEPVPQKYRKNSYR